MNSQSIIRIDRIAERIASAHLWIECAEVTIQRGELVSVKKRIERIREMLNQAESAIDEELAMPSAEHSSVVQSSRIPLRLKKSK